MARSRRETGAAGERLAKDHLIASGYRILQTNWRCRAGELDIVAASGDTLVFVEVRTRSSSSLHAFGVPAESVNQRKMAKLRILTQLYMQQTGRLGVPVRIDVIGVTMGNDGTAVELFHLKDAIS